MRIQNLFILIMFLTTSSILSCSKDEGDNCKLCSRTQTIIAEGVILTEAKTNELNVCGEELDQIMKNPIIEVTVNYLGVQASQRTLTICR